MVNYNCVANFYSIDKDGNINKVGNIDEGRNIGTPNLIILAEKSVINIQMDHESTIISRSKLHKC